MASGQLYLQLLVEAQRGTVPGAWDDDELIEHHERLQAEISHHGDAMLTFLSAKGDGAEAPRHSKPKLEYDVGESVRVKEGPFADFTGSVAEINVDHLKLKVLVNIFGRETLVEMDFSQVAKI